MSFDIEDAHKVICLRTVHSSIPPEIAAALSPFLCSCAPPSNCSQSSLSQCSLVSRLTSCSNTSHVRANLGHSVDITVPHIEEAAVALWKPGVALTPYGHMIAGAAAGVAEHCLMYPFDTLKTRLQVSLPLSPTYRNVAHAARHAIAKEGLLSLYRGVTAVCTAAIPSHALYFATYELSKKTFKGSGYGNKIFGDMLAGASATIVHDAIVTPLDVVKQRMQLFNSKHTSVMQTIKSVYSQCGIKGFYSAYPVTLAMNVPHFSLYFATYEQTKRMLQGAPASSDNSSFQFTPASHCIAGAAAGASSSLVSNPLDVIKTRLQTQGEIGGKLGIAQTIRLVYSEGGVGAFFRGLGARMLYHAPAAAFQMVTYEAVKVALTAALWGGIFVAMSKQERKALKMEQRAAEERAAAAAVRGDNGVCGEQVK